MSLQKNRFFQVVRQHADSMLECGRGVVEGQPCPLFAGVVDAGRREPITFLTPPPPGIRISDFNWCGNNLMHDLPLLEVLRLLGNLTGEAHYGAAVEAVFEYYGAHCPHPLTGLFPWGEHAQWSFADRETLPCSFTHGLDHFPRQQNLIHDHLAFAPAWFWQGMWEHHPNVVTRFAHGLDGHIVDAKTFEHNRHGKLSAGWWHDPHRPSQGEGKDFARHAGFFIFDCLFAYARSGDESLLDWARRKLKWHLDRRMPNGIIRGCVRSKAENEEGQHDSLALSLADAAEVLGDTPVGREFSAYAEELFEARRRQLPNTPLPIPDAPGDARLWLDGYIRKPSFGVPFNVDALMYGHTGISWYADSIVETAHWLQKHLPEPPPRLPVLARRFWFHLEAMLAAYAVSGDASFLESAAQIADWVERDLLRNGLLLGCSNLVLMRLTGNIEIHSDPWTEPNTPGFYYSVAATNNLLRALLRLSLLQEGQADLLGADPYRR